MNAFKKTLVAIVAAATLGATALTSTQALAWCNDNGYNAYQSSDYNSYQPSPSYNSDDSYGSYGYDHRDHYEHRNYDHYGYNESHRRH